MIKPANDRLKNWKVAIDSFACLKNEKKKKMLDENWSFIGLDG